MYNVFMLAAESVVCFSLLVMVAKFFGKPGLYVWMAVASILAEIQACVMCDFVGVVSTLGNVWFASNFLATDILNEVYGHEAAIKAVKLQVAALLTYIIGAQITLLYQPSSFDMAMPALMTTFSMSIRTTGASVICLVAANWLSVQIYSRLRDRIGHRLLWLRENIADTSANVIENFAFMFLAFGGLYSMPDLLVMIISVSVIETIISFIDTPFLYLARRVMGEGEPVIA